MFFQSLYDTCCFYCCEVQRDVLVHFHALNTSLIASSSHAPRDPEKLTRCASLSVCALFRCSVATHTFTSCITFAAVCNVHHKSPRHAHVFLHKVPAVSMLSFLAPLSAAFHQWQSARCATLNTSSSTRMFSVFTKKPYRLITSTPKMEACNETSKSSPTSQNRLYCQKCGSLMHLRKPPNDDRVRNVCSECSYIHYENPKLVVSSVPTSIDKARVLLTKRSIPPVGKWTLPAGFMELGEDTRQAAAREALEECNAQLKVAGIIAVYNIPVASQVQIVYLSILQVYRG